ncbi:MAG: nucleoside transporter C-terminal domain-containing protein [Bacteroidota bacterium]
MNLQTTNLRSWLIGAIFCVCTFFPTLSWGQKLNMDSVLTYTWQVTDFSDPEMEGAYVKTAYDSLDLRSDGSFRMSLQNDSAFQKNGFWRYRNDSLILMYNRIPQLTAIDSVVFRSDTVGAEILFMSQGEAVATQSEGSITSARISDRYLVDFDLKGELTLTGQEQSMLLSGRRTYIQEDFSFVSILRGIMGIVFLLFVAWLFSSNRQAINWRLVGIGMGLQIILAILVLKVPGFKEGFRWIANGFVEILNFTLEGSTFMFGSLMDIPSVGFLFAFQVLPTIVFFSALMAILYYLGIIQKVVYGLAWVLSKTMGLSGAESLAAAGNIFLGQTEAPLLVRHYLDKMTRSEIMALMTGGMATIAGGVFAAYVVFLGGADKVQQQIFATHLLTASIMSAPAALVAAKMMVPQTEKINPDLSIPKDKVGSNILDAITRGTTDGLKLAVNVGVMLLVFIALIRMLNYILADQIGGITGLNEWVASSTDGRFAAFNLQYIMGLIFAPVAWLLGVHSDDMMIVGQLLGEKTIINELVAYTSLGTAKSGGAIFHYKSVIIATYALCGFANFSSIGIQIGGIGALAPSQRKTLAALGVKSLIGGTIAAFLTASLAGMLVGI